MQTNESRVKHIAQHDSAFSVRLGDDADSQEENHGRALQRHSDKVKVDIVYKGQHKIVDANTESAYDSNSEKPTNYMHFEDG